MKITIQETEKIAKLARLEITDDEKKVFSEQLTNILDYVETLNKLDTTNIEPTSHILNLSNVFREDNLKDSLERDTVMALAPDNENGCFKVPKVIE